MTIKRMTVFNNWWNSYKFRVISLFETIDRKRFTGSYEGDINLDEVIFLWQGLVTEANNLQIEVNTLKNEIATLKDEAELLKAKTKTDVITG